MDLRDGVILRDYRIIRLLGEGGMGEVYLAEHTLLGSQVAIKRLNPALTKDAQFSERFLNEARIQAKLIHPNIVALQNFFVEDGVYYMVMEFAEGRMLKDVIAETGPIPEQRSLHIFRQLIAALGYAHSKQIIHRDIKPSNIMLDAKDNVKLMDFGIARLLSDRHMTQTGAKLGTLYYMSPEQVLADKTIDHRTDIYSAGIVLYEMLTGKLPYTADTDSDFIIMKEITEKRTPDPRDVYPHISENMVQLVREMTAKDREMRADTKSVINIIYQLSKSKTNDPDENPKPSPKSSKTAQLKRKECTGKMPHDVYNKENKQDIVVNNSTNTQYKASVSENKTKLMEECKDLSEGKYKQWIYLIISSFYFTPSLMNILSEEPIGSQTFFKAVIAVSGFIALIAVTAITIRAISGIFFMFRWYNLCLKWKSASISILGLVPYILMFVIVVTIVVCVVYRLAAGDYAP